MTHLKHQNHGPKFIRQNLSAIFASTKMERAAKIAKLNSEPADEDVWLKKMIQELPDADPDHDY